MPPGVKESLIPDCLLFFNGSTGGVEFSTFEDNIFLRGAGDFSTSGGDIFGGGSGNEIWSGLRMVVTGFRSPNRSVRYKSFPLASIDPLPIVAPRDPCTSKVASLPIMFPLLTLAEEPVENSSSGSCRS